MRLRLIRRGAWTLYAVATEREEAAQASAAPVEHECQLLTFLAGSLDPSDSLAKNKAEMLQRLAYVAEHGPPRNTDISHQVAGDIFQLEKGRIRAMYFYGHERRTLIFSHSFMKASQKTRRSDIERAESCLKAYRKALRDGTLIVPKEEG